jgi:diphthamide synthase (EF-2-diphthine--ammonia ligase)
MIFASKRFRSLSRVTSGSLSMMSGFSYDIEEAHRVACKNDSNTYIDPSTGYSVFTEEALRKRGKCCGNGCRHCPYGHFNVPKEWRSAQPLKGPTLLRTKRSTLGKRVDVEDSKVRTALFFSGGKNSYLTLKEIEKQGKEIILFTVFNIADNMLPYQGVSIHDVMDQAKALKKDCLLVPQDGPSNESYLACVREGLQVLRQHTKLANDEPLEIAFGDVSVKECRRWREELFDSIDPSLTCVFPIWGMSSDSMVQTLEEMDCDVEVVKAIDEELIGNKFGHDLIGKLAPNASRIGELGEYDTLVRVRTSP